MAPNVGKILLRGGDGRFPHAFDEFIEILVGVYIGDLRTHSFHAVVAQRHGGGPLLLRI